MQIDPAFQGDRNAVVAQALDLIWSRCCGKAPPAANRVGRVIDEKAKDFIALGEAATKEKFRIGLELAFDNLPKILGKFCAEVMPELAKTKIICFSERKDINLMWSHYGEGHTGLVFEFQNVDGRDSVYRLAKSVAYSDHPPQFSDDETLCRILAGDDSFSDEITDPMIYTKSAEWSYEKEWRIPTGNGRQPNDQVEYAGFFTEELSAVYFGCRASQGTKNLLVPLIRHRYPAAKIWQARRETHSYVLVFDVVS